MSHLTLMFDGILNVSAKDLGTGKEQKVTIAASNELSDEEIELMVKEAEAFKEKDKKKREEIETSSEANSLIYTVEKYLKENRNSIDDSTIDHITSKIAGLKEAIEGSDTESVKSAIESLTKVFHQTTTSMYKKTT